MAGLFAFVPAFSCFMRSLYAFAIFMCSPRKPAGPVLLSKLSPLHACRAGECVVQLAVASSKLRYYRASQQRVGEVRGMTRTDVSGWPAALLTVRI